jgi:hypothetical protein
VDIRKVEELGFVNAIVPKFAYKGTPEEKVALGR